MVFFQGNSGDKIELTLRDRQLLAKSRPPPTTASLRNTHVVLDMEGYLEIVAPVLTLVAVFGQDGVVEEDV